MVFQATSLFGALMVLGAYFALQRGWLAGDDRLLNLLNFVGAGMLTWVAVKDRRIGVHPARGGVGAAIAAGGPGEGEGVRDEPARLVPRPASRTPLLFGQSRCKLGLSGVTRGGGPPVSPSGEGDRAPAAAGLSRSRAQRRPAARRRWHQNN